MTKHPRDPLEDDWDFEPYRLILEDPAIDYDNFVLELPLLTKAKLLKQLVLPKRFLPESEITQVPLSSLLGNLPPSSLTKVPPWFQVTKSFVQLCQTEEGEDVILICKCGHGKTTIVSMYFLDRTYANCDIDVLSLVPYRAVGKTQLEKFMGFSEMLVEEESKCEGYFWGNNLKKQDIRESEEDISMLVTTFLTYLGSLTRYFPEHYVIDGKKKFKSYDLQWAYRLTYPSYLFIEEIDSFSADYLSLLIPVVRTLKWKNPELQLILSSGTLGNYEDIAKAFFGNNNPYKLITGSGRRGELHINVYYETKRQEALEEALLLIMEHIDNELRQLQQNPNYKPKKVILFLNNKLEIELRNIRKVLSDHFLSVHGNMFFERITKNIDEFQTDPYKICLIATQIIQSGVDLPDVKWAVFYGILENPQQYQQIRERINRNPNHIGRLDIILRDYYDFERELSDPKKEDELKAFVLQEDPIPLCLPWYTPLSLRLWIVFATLLRVTDILWRIEKDLSHLSDSFEFQRHLREAFHDLLAKNVIRINSEGQFKITPQTKKWIFGLVKKDEQRSYSIICKEKGESELVGKIDYLTLLRHHLVGQNLPLEVNYEVIQVLKNKKKREVHVKRIPADHFYYRNQVESSLHRSALHAINWENRLALVSITRIHEVTDPDNRTNDPEIAMDIEPLRETYQAIFIGREAALSEEKCELTESYLQNSILPNLPFQYPLELTEYEDPSLGDGFLLIDTSHQKIVDFLFEHLQKKVLSSSSQNKSILSDISQEEVNKIQEIHCSLCDTPFKHFKQYRKRFQNVIVIIPDVHLNGEPFKIQDKTINFKAFWYYLLSNLKSATLIVFNGDMIDWTDTKEEMRSETLSQYYIIREISDELNIGEKVKFLLGNHDFDSNIFVWKKPTFADLTLELQINPQITAQIRHGHNIGLETLGELTEKSLQILRKRLKVSDNCVLGLGHTHDLYGRCKKPLKVLQVPPFKKYWKSPLKKGLGWLGLLGYGSKIETNNKIEDWEIAIDA